MAAIHPRRLQEAAERLLQGAILGEHPGAALECIASASHGSGAMFIRSIGDKALPVSNVSMDQSVAEFRSQRASQFSEKLLMSPPTKPSFSLDLGQKLIRSALYQDFMRPNGMAWRAEAWLTRRDNDVCRFVFYRSEQDGPFQVDELRHFNGLLQYLHVAATIYSTTFERLYERQLSVFDRRGYSVFRLRADGQVVSANVAADTIPSSLLSIARGRLTLRISGEQSKLDHAIRNALSDRPRPTLMRISGARGFEGPLVLVLPIRGLLRDVFAQAVAFIVVIDGARRLEFSRQSLDLLRCSFHLTPRETSIVSVVASGRKLSEGASHLDIGVGTARNHLKAAMQKIGVHSQVELTALITEIADLIDGPLRGL